MWADVEDSGPALKQHWVNVLYLLVSEDASHVWRGVYCVYRNYDDAAADLSTAKQNTQLNSS